MEYRQSHSERQSLKSLRQGIDNNHKSDLPYRLVLRFVGALVGAAAGALTAYLIAQKIEGSPPVDPGFVTFGALVGLLLGYLLYPLALYPFVILFQAMGPIDPDKE
jgi:hypothetical protein